ncbi:hypothetical protein HZS61_002601 [Fusarium oxysporum f. sp. conglutinans]|uniref:ABC-2 type transporter transmembrane domain-containing protein n=1 Tax=Fusarium oxysporum f. sp. conglutinans TaxID=100902 RepID=A0A8H6LGJ6_FUSOX|nr:hypothetical protein HZS61_002601 [Fusarium oxysporum f. sp. conglutinans]
MDCLLSHYENEKRHYSAPETRDERILHAIDMGWFIMDKYYTMTEDVPVYSAALLLDLSKRDAYIKQNWPDAWYDNAIGGAQEIWEEEYNIELPTKPPAAPSAVADIVEHESNKLAQLARNMKAAHPGQSILGVQNAIFSVLMVCAMFSSLVQQIMPKFVVQRTLYEVRERHSNMYSWSVLILANILVEIPYHVVLGVMAFAIFNYTVFGIRSSEDQGLVLLFFVYFYILAGTFAHMVVAPLPDATTAGRVVTILFSMMILFAGVFQTPIALPGFWIFMYCVSPMTYLVGGDAVSGLLGDPIVCSHAELAVFQPPTGETCGAYMQPYLEQAAPGTLLNPDATASCSYCPLGYADQVLARSDMRKSIPEPWG